MGCILLNKAEATIRPEALSVTLNKTGQMRDAALEKSAYGPRIARS